MSPKRCWYCGVTLAPAKDQRPTSRTTEHLVARAHGGIGHRSNIRLACHRCNTFVGAWPLEDKIRFRAMIRQLGGWPGLRRLLGRHPGLSWRVRCELAAMDSPRDPVSMRAREALEIHRRTPPEVDPAPPPQRVLVDLAPLLADGTAAPDDLEVAAWRFEIGEAAWQSTPRPTPRRGEGGGSGGQGRGGCR